ncbi:hypothetical protein [Mesorhizobium retamae]|uniref:Lipoprotein n=1 Tax=Mesorhizobium retamae TaxID=2912854 RepID=A0ABS9QQX6_9HYPH|nr:hypothetical protein [Mesorhizobium sp. IRAMC:0171]MCG7509106.1 hypothetical protein [Mesorhizobium sp. IRAMC:0171]
MADSDNSTTLPSVTRRAVLLGAAVAVAACDQAAVVGADGEAEPVSDPSLVVWRRWQLARQETERLCRKQQSLERRLLETVGIPQAGVPVLQARWDAADKACGYSDALHAEQGAADRMDALLGALCETPAKSLAGVAAKLDAVLKEAEPSEHDGEFPWPLIRSALDDLVIIAGKAAPGQTSFDDIRLRHPSESGEGARRWTERQANG